MDALSSPFQRLTGGEQSLLCSVCGMSQAPPNVPYIGSKISLISKSEIRYEGILYTINTKESTVALQQGTNFKRHHSIFW